MELGTIGYLFFCGAGNMQFFPEICIGDTWERQKELGHGAMLIGIPKLPTVSQTAIQRIVIRRPSGL